MATTFVRSSALVSAVGVALLGAVLTGSTVTVPAERSAKGDLRLSASDCYDGCTKGETRIVRFETVVSVDRANGLVILERERVGD